MQLHPIRFRIEDSSRAGSLLESVAQLWPSRIHRSWRRSTTYFDTFDWRLWATSSVLWSADGTRSPILYLQPGDGSSRRQTKISKSPGFVWDLPQGPLRKFVEPVVGVRRLLDIALIRAHGTALSVLDQREKTVAMLRFEHRKATKALGGKKCAELPQAVTLIPVRGYGEAFDQLRSFLQRELENRPLDVSELVEAAQALGLEPSGYSKKLNIDLDPSTSAAAAMITIHRRLLEIMGSNEWGLGLDLDTEFLHDFRVAGRRTRSALSQIKGVFPTTVTEHFKKEFARLGKITSPCRDLDVCRLKFPSYASSLPSKIRDDLEPLRDFLEHHQKTEHKRVVELLESERYALLKQDWESFLDTDPASLQAQPNSTKPIRELASKRIWRNYKRVLERGSALDLSTAADTLHRLRIDCKKLRYLLEFFRSLYPEPEIHQLIEELKRLQDNLGDFNDFEVQQARLREFGQTMVLEKAAPATTIFAMGRLTARLEEGQKRERERFHRRYERFSSGKNRRLFKRLFKSPIERRT